MARSTTTTCGAVSGQKTPFYVPLHAVHRTRTRNFCAANLLGQETFLRRRSLSAENDLDEREVQERARAVSQAQLDTPNYYVA